MRIENRTSKPIAVEYEYGSGNKVILNVGCGWGNVDDGYVEIWDAETYLAQPGLKVEHVSFVERVGYAE